MAEVEEKVASTPAERLRAIADSVYAEAWEAKKRGELIGWSTAKFPGEVAYAFDLKLCYPENFAATVAAKKGGRRMCEEAESIGFSTDLCAYCKIGLAQASGFESEEKPMPQPDFLFACNNTCNLITKWFENLARIKDIPLIYLDVPYNNDMEVSDMTAEYMVGQFHEAVRRLEEISGKKFDQARFDEACENSNRAGRAWDRIVTLCKNNPSPMNGFDLFNNMTPLVTARCRVETAIALEDLAEVYEENVRTGKTTWKADENYRIMFEGIPNWHSLKAQVTPLKAEGMNSAAMVYAPAFAFTYDDLPGMMKAYAKAPGSISLEAGTKWREDLCRQNEIDGILVHYNRSCRPWSGYMLEMQRRWEKDLGIPAVGYDGDQADIRNFSEEQYNTRVQGLKELMDNMKAKGANA